MRDIDLIWNRATMDKGGKNPAKGDRALARLLRFHGLAMNGGILHAIELHSESRLDKVQDAYRFFGLSTAADLISSAREIFEIGVDLGSYEAPIDMEYYTLANDSILTQRFEEHIQLHSEDFAPL